MSMKETPISGEAIIKAEEAKMMGTSGVEAGSFENDQTGSKKETWNSPGKERLAQASIFVAEAKTKATGWFKSVGSSISKFFKKTGSVAYEGLAGVASAPELVTKGADYAMDKADAYDKASEKVAYEAGVGMGKGLAEVYDKAKQGVEAVGNAMNKGGDALMNWGERTGDKLNAMGDKTVEFISDKVLRGGDATVEAFKSAAKWTDEKITATADYLTEKQNLVADKLIYAGEKTSEKLGKVKYGVANQFNNIKKFGENSWMSAKMRIAEIKQNRRDRKNEKLRLAAEAKYNAEIAQLQADLENNKQGEEWAKNQAEAYRKNQEIIQAKLDHMTNVENLFNRQVA